MPDLGEMKFRAQQLGQEGVGRRRREHGKGQRKEQKWTQRAARFKVNSALQKSYSKPLISLAPLEVQGHHPNKLCIPHPHWMQTTRDLALSKITRRAFLHITRSQAHCEVLANSGYSMADQNYSACLENWTMEKKRGGKGKRNNIAESSTEEPWILNRDIFIIIAI